MSKIKEREKEKKEKIKIMNKSSTNFYKIDKNKLEKNMEDNEQSLKNILKSEIMKENKIRKIRKEINQKEEKYNEFINERKEGIKFLENERYKYLKDREERTKLYNKMMINFGHRINLSNIINKGNNGKIKPNSKDKAEESNISSSNEMAS